MQNQIAISIALLHMLSTNQLNKTNTIVLLQEIIERLENEFPHIDGREKIEYIVHFLKEVAKGKDGIMGTQDDIIPPNVLTDIQKLVDTNVLHDIIQLCKDVYHKKKIDPIKLSFCCLKIL
jgi:hypothetical protein